MATTKKKKKKVVKHDEHGIHTNHDHGMGDAHHPKKKKVKKKK